MPDNKDIPVFFRSSTDSACNIAEKIYKSRIPTILLIETDESEVDTMNIDILVDTLWCHSWTYYRTRVDMTRNEIYLVGYVVRVDEADAAAAALAMPGCVTLTIEMLTEISQTGIQAIIKHLRCLEREKFKLRNLKETEQ